MARRRSEDGEAERDVASEPRRRGRSGSRGTAAATIGRGLDTGVAVAIAVCAFIVLSRFMAWTIHPLVVFGQAALPITLLPAWPAVVVAALRRLPVRFVLALLLVISHVLALLPATGTRALPDWARTPAVASPVASPVASALASADTTRSPVGRLRIVSANVYYGNQDSRLAQALLGADADLYVLVEVSPTQQALFQRAGMFERFPYRIETAPNAKGSTVIVSRLPLQNQVTQLTPGGWTPSATVTVQGHAVRVIAAHPRSPIDACCLGQLVDWLHWVREQGRSTTGPLVVAGDFNATRFVPAMGELFASGFIDAHESRGRGLTTSWPVGGTFFDLPLMRLDHVLYRGKVAATSVHDLSLPGSDHLGIVAELAFG